MEQQNIKENTKTTEISDQKSKWELTSLLMALAGLVMFFFLVSGSITENRFGTHLVWSNDLSATPMWFSLIIVWLAAAIVIAAVVIFSFSYNGKLKLSEERLRALRIGSWALIGTSAFYIALSSITFAVFNTDFFSNTLNTTWTPITPVHWLGNTVHTVMTPAVQSVVIGWLTLITIFAVVIGTTAVAAFGVNISEKMYYTARNTTVALIAIGWLVFNINLMGFGAMGGDAGVLVNGVLGTNVDWTSLGKTVESLGNELNDLGYTIEDLQPLLDAVVALPLDEIGSGLTAWGAMEPKEAYQALQAFAKAHDIGGKLGDALIFPWAIAQAVFNPLWTNKLQPLVSTVGPILPALWTIIPGLEKLAPVLVTIANPITGVGSWVSQLYKPSIFQGVNGSFVAISIMILLVSSLVWIPALTVTEHFMLEDSRRSMTWKASMWTIIGISIIFFVLAWTVPYIDIWAGANDFNPVIDGLIGGKHNGLAPGLVGQAGEQGGICGALVYYSPLYHGTATWWIALSLVVITPLAAIAASVVTTLRGSKTEE